MSLSCNSIHVSPTPTKRCQNIYSTPRRRHKSIRTVADVPLSHSKNSNNNKHKHSICCICLESMDISDIASLNSCSHKYHHDCILSWSSIENACPLCKTKFTEIIDISNNNKRIAIINKKQEASYHIDLGNIIWLDCICTYCGSDDNEHLLLLCDGCDDAAHTYCIGLGDNVPQTAYYCVKCESEMMQIYNNTINTSENDNITNSVQSESELSENLNQTDSDEEYKPTPKPKRKKKKYNNNNNNNNNKKRERFPNNVSDEEYIPPNNINVCTYGQIQTRSQRLQMKSLSPQSKKGGSLVNLPVSFSRHNNSNIRTQRMVVIDQNNNKHFLGLIKKKHNKNGYKRSSLANLFNDTFDDNKNNKYEISDNSDDIDLDINNNNNNNSVRRRISDSEYEPSDYISDCDIKINRRKRKKCNKILRRSQRLRQQQLDLLSDNDESESSESDNEMDNRYKYKKNNRKRSLKQLEDFNDCNKKRVKYNDMKSRRYSSLSQL